MDKAVKQSDKPGRAATLIPYARSILQAMKENGYRGTVWDEVLNEYEKATAPLPETGALDALRELVTLKNLKDALDGIEAASELGAELHQQRLADYQRRKPLAWERARAVVAGTVSATRTPTVEAIKESIQRNVALPGWAYEDEIVRVVRDFAPSTRGLTFEQVRDALVTRMNGHTIGASDLPAFRSFVGLLKRTEAADCGIALSATGTPSK